MYGPLFASFKQYLDDAQAQRERVIRAGRDITQSSKKAIFALQRAPVGDSGADGYKSAQKHLDEALKAFNGLEKDLYGTNGWRYSHQMSGAVQEFIEALSFQHYLLHGQVIALAEVQETIPGHVVVTISDYILGLMDLTGEMMRYAIGHISGGSDGPSKEALDICNTLRTIKSQLVDKVDGAQFSRALGAKEWDKKVSTFNACVEKVERALYSQQIRTIDQVRGKKRRRAS